jgi:hypothetical protein
MEVSEHWVYQGRHEHGWFGHGTAPKADKDGSDQRGGRLFDLGGVGPRVDWVADSLVGHLSRQDRGRPAARIEGAARD